MAQKGKIVVKKWFLGAKKWVIGRENNELATKLERLNGAKCRSSSLK